MKNYLKIGLGLLCGIFTSAAIIASLDQKKSAVDDKNESQATNDLQRIKQTFNQIGSEVDGVIAISQGLCGILGTTTPRVITRRSTNVCFIN